MRAYLREDGNYDVFPDSVEPTIVAASEIEAIVKKEELKTRREQILKELAEIDETLGTGNHEQNEVSQRPADAQNQAEMQRKRW